MIRDVDAPTDSGVGQGSWQRCGRRITRGCDAPGVVLADDVAGALDTTTALIAPGFAGPSADATAGRG
ncbi:hypothetical protein ACFQ6Q_19105 [Streptomyces sp. NPDC056437]|uniref:hypothetical protein n=1 Tax=Streptomyces sp. NPDC056437 TaxID=3345816 RepID=UPI0036B8FE38